MTINIEELKRDREAGTPGEWVVHGRETKRSQIDVGCNLIGPTRRVAGIYQPFDGRLSADANARRIARLPDLEAAFLEAVELLKNAMSIVENCTIEDGVCCCGDDMRRHAEPMHSGHSPIDRGAYVADEFYKVSSIFLDKIT